MNIPLDTPGRVAGGWEYLADVSMAGNGPFTLGPFAVRDMLMLQIVMRGGNGQSWAMEFNDDSGAVYAWTLSGFNPTANRSVGAATFLHITDHQIFSASNTHNLGNFFINNKIGNGDGWVQYTGTMNHGFDKNTGPRSVLANGTYDPAVQVPVTKIILKRVIVTAGNMTTGSYMQVHGRNQGA